MEKRQLGSNTASLADYSLFDAINTLKRMGFATIELLAFCNARRGLRSKPVLTASAISPDSGFQNFLKLKKIV